MRLVRMRSPLEVDALTMLFPSPLLHLDLTSALPAGTLESLAESVMHSWRACLAEQESLPADAARRRATDDDAPLRAQTQQQQNEEFFYFQRRHYGTTQHASEPTADSWLASAAAQELIECVTAAGAGYLERLAHYQGLDVGRPWAREDWALDPDSWHIWASVHSGASNHPSHVHANAVVSAVFYVRVPEGSGPICFMDPRGRIPPFERQVRHTPSDGELLIFPPWLPHAVASGGEGDDARISISFNLVDPDLEGGRNGWGEATASLAVVTLEDGLGLGGEAFDEE